MMDPDAPNPYDYQRPVTESDRLVGRASQLATARRLLKQTADGNPRHLALIGPRAAGKTSLLYGIEVEARGLQILPVWLKLDEETVESPFAFFRALFEAFFLALIDAGVLTEGSAEYVAWSRQVNNRDTSIGSEEQPLLFGALAAGRGSSEEAPDVPPAALDRDIQKIAIMARSRGFKGIVILCDEADQLRVNAAVLQKLRNVIQASRHCMLVLAGVGGVFEDVKETFSRISRHFVFERVERFHALSYVIQCIVTPLDEDQRHEITLTLQSVWDIAQLTGGEPFQITLVCHFVWEALRKHEQEEFGLSATVIGEVVQTLRDIAREETSEGAAIGETADTIEAIRRLSTADLRATAEIAPFESLTLEEIAHWNLFPAPFNSDQLAEQVKRREDQITRLERLGVLVQVADRTFALRGDEFSLMYLRYLLTSDHDEVRPSWPAPYTSYGDLVGRAIGKEMLEAVTGEEHPKLFALQDEALPREEWSEAGNRLDRFERAAAANAVTKMAEQRNLIPQFPSLQSIATDLDATRPAIFAGLVLSVELGDGSAPELREYGALVSCDNAQPAMALQEELAAWIGRRQEDLKLYGVRVERAFTTQLAGETAHDFLVTMSVPFAMSEMFDEFRRGDLRVAAQITERILPVADRLLESGRLPSQFENFEPPQLRSKLGFLYAVMGDNGRARSYIAEVGEDSKTLQLDTYNSAYLAACDGQFEEAATMLESIDLIKLDRQGPLIMVAFIPSPGDWTPPSLRWNVSTRVTRLARWMAIQHTIYRALAGALSYSDFLERCGNEPDAADGPTVDRMVGWTIATVFDDPTRALEWFRSAREKPPGRRLIETELDFVRGLSEKSTAPTA